VEGLAQASPLVGRVPLVVEGLLMEHTPITKQRSQWVRFDGPEIPGAFSQWWTRNVSDGVLSMCVALEPLGWHMSISFRDHKGRLTRYPTWDEIAQAREQFLADELEFVMFLPRVEEYVALHDTTFHLYQHPAVEP
jgi:hypothetical protein